MILAPMATDGTEPVGSMGNDAPLAVLSDRPQLLFNYFKQLFAQVTNPPVDSIREELIMSVETSIGPELNLLQPTPESARQIELPSPILANEELEKLRHLDGTGPGATGSSQGFKTLTIPILYRVDEGGVGLEKALDEACQTASEAIADGYEFLILSDWGLNRLFAPIPALLAVGAVHHHLIREGTRTRVGLILESGEPREVHHFALLIGYGASAVNPYLAFETLDDMILPGNAPRTGAQDRRQELRQVDQQGRPQGDVQNGHFDNSELSRRADFRGDRPGQEGDRFLFYRDAVAGGGNRHRSDRAGGETAP